LLNQLLIVLSQLRQMLLAWQSPEMPMKDQQQPMPPIVLQSMRLTLHVIQIERYSRFSYSVLHVILSFD
jgi:hypothetical protein